MSDWFRHDTVAGEPVQAGDVTLTPFANSLRIQLPIANLTVGWHRPASVLVRDASGAEEVLPVVDVTRYTIYALTGLSVLTWVLSWYVDRRRRAEKDQE